MGIYNWLGVGMKCERMERGGSPLWSLEALEPRLLLSADVSPLEVLPAPLESTVDSVISIDLVSDDGEDPDAGAGELSLTLEEASPEDGSAQEQARMESLSALAAEVECRATSESSLSSPLSQNDAGGEMPADSVAQSSVTEQLVETLHVANGPPQQDPLGAQSAPDALWIGSSESLSGNVALDGDVVILGTLSPGNSPGIITIDGDLTFNGADPDTVGDGYTPPPGPGAQDTVGGLVIEIGGLTPGPGGPGDANNGYDQVNVTGAVGLGGTLQIVLINDFIPSPGATFDFLTFGSVAGQFSQITGPFDFGGTGLYFEVIQQSDRLQLVASEIPAGPDLHITTAATTRMEDALEGLADQADLLLSDLLLATPELMGRTLPGTGVTLDELFGISDYLDIGPALDAYRAPMEELGSDVRFEIDEFLNYLRGSWLDDRIGGQAHDIDFSNLIYMSSRYDWIGGILLEFSGSDTYTASVPVGLSQVVEGIGPAYTDREVTIDVDFAFTLSLGWDDSTGATYDFQVTRLELDASFDSSDLVIPFMIGGLEAAAGHPQHTAGTMQFGAHLDLAYNDAQDEYQVTYDPVTDAVSSLDLYLPVYAALAGVDVNQGPLATISLSGGPFPDSRRRQGGYRGDRSLGEPSAFHAVCRTDRCGHTPEPGRLARSVPAPLGGLGRLQRRNSLR